MCVVMGRPLKLGGCRGARPNVAEMLGIEDPLAG
jgi:hypothetical protein